MRVVGSGAVAAAMLVWCASAATGQGVGGAAGSVAAVPVVVTSASGDTVVQSDRAAVAVAVETRAVSAAAAAAQNARLLRQVLDTLRGLGLAADQLSTVGFSVSPEFQYRQGEPQRVTGYVARNGVRADVRRVEMVGPVIDAALARGANLVSSLRFFSSHEQEARSAALAAAVRRARVDAEAIARAAGGSVGAPVEITAGSVERPYQPALELSARAMAGGAPPTPIEPGVQTVSATVTVRWTFVSGR